VSGGSSEPSSNPRLFGHRRAEEIWLRAWRSNRLPHAWLLTGPRGVGKATLAYRLARAYLAGFGAEPSWHDPAAAVFRMVANRAHPDLLILEPRETKGGAREQKVEEVRDTLEGLYRTSAAGRRICLIDDADTTLNRHGENTLLKVLEEPPPGLVFLLVAQRPAGLLPTVRSRCAALRLAPLPERDMADALGHLAAPDADLDRLTELGEGSPGRALALGGLDWSGAYAELLRALPAKGDAGRLQALGAATRLLEAGGFRTATTVLAVLLRRLVRQGLARPPARELFAGEAAALEAAAAGASLDRRLAVWEEFAALAERVEAVNLDPLQALMRVAIGLGAPPAGPAAARESA
jgi:DNA polymerase-3 subunit delta'